MLLWGGIFGAYMWTELAARGLFASSGTVMLAAMPFLLGAQFLMGFIAYDIQQVPREPVHRLLRDRRLSHLYERETAGEHVKSAQHESPLPSRDGYLQSVGHPPGQS
jgi:hypothetical protein